MGLLHPDEIRTVPGEDDGARDQPTRTLKLEDGRVLRLRRCRLKVVNGPDAGRELVSEAERIRIGADPSSDLAVPGDGTASRSHCEIVFTEKGYLLVDRGSTNGTFVDGRRVERAYLGLASDVRVGSTRIAFEAKEERTEIEPLSGEIHPGVVADAPAMRQLFGVVKKLAPLPLPVLLEGENGVGRDTVAQVLHAMSARSGAFAALDVSTLPDDALEAELLGAEGALTRAQGGTLFLDGFDELSYAFQPKLLRALDGAAQVRFVVGARSPLQARVEQGAVRPDLFFRLSVVPLTVPPLRERKTDVPALLAKALEEAGAQGRTFAADAVEALCAYGWPGNVRELFNLVAHLAASSPAQVLDVRELPARILGQATPLAFNEHLTFKAAKENLLERFEREYLTDLLGRCDGNLSRAARESGLHRKSIERLVKKYQIDAKALRARS